MTVKQGTTAVNTKVKIEDAIETKLYRTLVLGYFPELSSSITTGVASERIEISTYKQKKSTEG